MRAYGRRHRRWAKRHAEPLMLVANDGYAADVLAALGRLLFRHRSALAPFTTALTLAAAGLVLHLSHRAWWPLVLGGTVVTMLTVAVTGAPFRADRASERVYAAATTGAAGGWLAAATAFGPWRSPLPTLLVLGVLLGGLPWWTHRRRRMRVRVDRSIQAWPEIAEAIGLAGSRVLSAVVDLWGWRARCSLRAGQTVSDVIAHVPAIESGLGTRPGAVRVEPDPAHAGRFLMRVLADDPHATAIPYPGASVRRVADPVALGVFEDGSPVRVSLLRRNGLIGGVVGSGKSGVLNVIIASLAACPDVVLWGIDLKGGMELRPWAPCFDRLATTPAEAAALMRDAVRIVEARARALGHQSARLWEPQSDAPALVLVVDEYAELTEHAPTAAESADSLARLGRAVAVTLLAATQRPSQQAMGHGAVRSQMDVRVCLRVRERRDADLILGQGMLAAGWHAHTLDAPGKFLLSAPGHDHPRRARAYLITDDDVTREAARWAPQRPALDELSADAIGGVQQPSTDAEQADPDIVDAEIVDEPADPETTLWMALREAPDEGLTVPELMMITGMGRTWIYDRLQSHAATNRASQATRGRWRATEPHRDRPVA
jgi:DNA segregation ATPase FtsK/SpoIIIE, S-DNA-T family